MTERDKMEEGITTFKDRKFILLIEQTDEMKLCSKVYTLCYTSVFATIIIKSLFLLNVDFLGGCLKFPSLFYFGQYNPQSSITSPNFKILVLIQTLLHRSPPAYIEQSA